ncbi:hypothetical protein AY600_02265 [Phormidium willei BDU 130791]|nr:hypothetical protein AY600_02265 [Phormidium willei BDU 130791]
MNHLASCLLQTAEGLARQAGVMAQRLAAVTSRPPSPPGRRHLQAAGAVSAKPGALGLGRPERVVTVWTRSRGAADHKKTRSPSEGEGLSAPGGRANARPNGRKSLESRL